VSSSRASISILRKAYSDISAGCLWYDDLIWVYGCSMYDVCLYASLDASTAKWIVISRLVGIEREPVHMWGANLRLIGSRASGMQAAPTNSYSARPVYSH
jgi:hypothetical protein